MLRRTFLALTLLSTLACGGSSTAGPRRTRDRITAEEIARVTVGTAYEVVESLRPEYLRTRGSPSLSGGQEFAVVYIDGVRAGGLNELRRVSREQLQEIRYLNGTDATTMYGTGHVGGAILVTTKR